MTLANTANAILVIPRGELYFDRFAAGTLVGEGELYLGNTPGFKVSRSFDETKRYTSYGGQVIERDAIVTQEKNTASIETDNISMENVALWFGGTVSDAGQAAVGLITETLNVRRGRWYQLGSSVNLAGVQYVEPGVEFSIDGNPISDVAANFTLNRPAGRFYVNDNAPDVIDGQDLDVTFEWREATGSFVIPSGKEVVGALRFISNNPVGPQLNYLFPYVRLSPSADVDMKSDDFLSLEFKVDIRKKFGTADFFYVTQVGEATYNADELYIINNAFVTLDEFVFYESIFNTVINTSMPAGNYGAPLS